MPLDNASSSPPSSFTAPLNIGSLPTSHSSTVELQQHSQGGSSTKGANGTMNCVELYEIGIYMFIKVAMEILMSPDKLYSNVEQGIQHAEISFVTILLSWFGSEKPV